MNMKKLIAVLLLMVMVVCALSVVAAATFEWTMPVGDTLSLKPSKTEYVSSDPSIVEIVHGGGNAYSAKAIAPGTATITGGTWMNSNHENYVITVTDPNSNETLNNIITPTLDASASASSVSLFSPLAFLPFLIVLIFIVCIFVLIFASLGKAKKLDAAMGNLQICPNQANAEAAVLEFTKINPIVKTNLSMGGDKRGTHFSMWRSVFNNSVVSSDQIRIETKIALRNALISMSTYGLSEVTNRPNATFRAPATCAKCGKPLDPSENFCTTCGTQRN